MLKYMLDTNICIYVITRRPLEALVLISNNLKQKMRVEMKVEMRVKSPIC